MTILTETASTLPAVIDRDIEECLHRPQVNE